MRRRLLYLVVAAAAAFGADAQPPGAWPEPRQNPHLTALQPMPGAMSNPPDVLAHCDLGRVRPTLTPVTTESGELGLAIVAGAVHAYLSDGSLQWRSHPRGLNAESIVAVDDFDGDGVQEILLKAGRPTPPYGAAVLLALDDGRVLWRYDVEPMSYAWYLYRGRFLANTSSQQFVVIMHGYPPDPQNGYIALFDYAEGTARPAQRWRYDFSEYTCFPSFLQTDLEGDGVKELVVQTHSRMWILDTATGSVKQFVTWDVAPANVRSYGYVGFVDLDADGLDDFLCIATFAQHHEVVMNRGGAFEKAWHYGWDESVTTGKVGSVYPERPYGDVDGDGALEIVVSVYNGDREGAWCTRVYDAVTGAIEQRIPGMAAVALHDVDGDGRLEILANATTDPTQATIDGAKVITLDTEAARILWEEPGAVTLVNPAAGPSIRKRDEVFTLEQDGDSIRLTQWVKPAKPVKERFAAIPAVVATTTPVLLAGDILEGGGNELVVYADPDVRVFQWQDASLVERGGYLSSAIPALADMNGDGACDLVLSSVAPDGPPTVRVLTPSQQDRAIWERPLPPVERAGLPQPRTAYLRTIHLTGKTTPDLYLWAGTPVVRSAGLDGRTGELLWEKGEVPNSERYWGASVNYASAYDYNGDGHEDLIFTNPDYYCVADGPTGDLLLGPAFPPAIFAQPCQGLYTYPAILPRLHGTPLVALVAGHYFHAVMTIDTQPLWYRIPAPGDNRAGAEAFLPLPDGAWVMGFGRQNGMFACVDAATGAVRWEYDLGATCADTIAGDVDGDGRNEFLAATSHGDLIALGDKDGTPRIVWKTQLNTALGAPILADITGDGKSEIVVAGQDGMVYLCR